MTGFCAVYSSDERGRPAAACVSAVNAGAAVATNPGDRRANPSRSEALDARLRDLSFQLQGEHHAVAKRSNKDRPEARKLTEAGITMIGLAGLFLVLPALLDKSPLGQALGSLRAIAGWALLLGVAFLAVGLLASKKATEARNAAGARVPSNARDASAPVRQVDPEFVGPPAPGNHGDMMSPTRSPARPIEWNRTVFEVIEWRRFEAVVERLFQQAGFETKSQSHGADEGVDVWLYSRHQPGEPVGLVQCKHWQGKKVGVDKVRELRGVMAAKNVKRGQFATSSTFTLDAVTFARESGINLLDARGLLDLINKRTPEQQAELLAVALDGDYWRPTCVNCGVKMVDRLPRGGHSPFWGCTNFPRCRTTLPIRGA